MAIDSTLAVRRAILAILKADAGVVALVPKANIHPMRAVANPVWPFIRYDMTGGVPIRASCIDGHDLTVRLHGFAGPRVSGKQVVETAEDVAMRIGAAIARAVDCRRADIENGNVCLTWTGGRLAPDPAEADIFHTIQNFRARCITARGASAGA